MPIINAPKVKKRRVWQSESEELRAKLEALLDVATKGSLWILFLFCAWHWMEMGGQVEKWTLIWLTLFLLSMLPHKLKETEDE